MKSFLIKIDLFDIYKTRQNFTIAKIHERISRDGRSVTSFASHSFIHSFIHSDERGRGSSEGTSVNKIENESTFPLVCYTGRVPPPPLPRENKVSHPLCPNPLSFRISWLHPGWGGSCKSNRAALWPRLVRSTMHWGWQSDTKGSGFLSLDSPLATWRGVYRWPWRISLGQSWLRVECRGRTKHSCSLNWFFSRFSFLFVDALILYARLKFHFFVSADCK